MTRRIGSLVLLLILGAFISSCTWFQIPIATVTLSPVAGAVNAVVAIVSTGFGATQGTSVVTFDGIQAHVVSWSDTSITAQVPVLPTPDGDRLVVVNVVRGGTTIGTALFTVQRGILFETYRDGNLEIYMMNPDGSNPTNLTKHPSTDLSAVWSPDGTKIAFTSDRDENDEVYVMNADGTNAVNLTTDPYDDFAPQWSPDGTKIAFQSDRETTGPILSYDPKVMLVVYNSEVFVMNADGSGQVNVSNHEMWDGNPSWSPGSDRIVFQSDRHVDPGPIIMGVLPDELGVEIYAVDADGTDLVNLTHSPGDDRYPVWAPDGTKIAFQSARDGNQEIYVMNPDGSGQTRLTTDVGYDSYPSWSPDSQWITFHSDRTGGTDLYKMTRVGLSTTRLTTSIDWDWGPSWSPDAQWIAFQTTRDGNSEIYRMRADGSGQLRLTNDPEWDMHPVWGTSSWMPPA